MSLREALLAVEASPTRADSHRVVGESEALSRDGAAVASIMRRLLKRVFVRQLFGNLPGAVARYLEAMRCFSL